MRDFLESIYLTFSRAFYNLGTFLILPDATHLIGYLPSHIQRALME